jgi:hypothetical protein
MSVNLNLSFEIHNIKDIHAQPDESKRREILAAAKTFIQGEGLLEDMEIDFIGQDGYLAAYTTSPVIISGFGRWQPDVEKRWEEMAVRVLGTDCKTKVKMDSPDEH